MKKILLIIIIFCSANLKIVAQQDILRNRTDLKELLDAREKDFQLYSVSLEKKSGIFGNKTKNDIRQSNEVLTGIVKKDNQIISLLNRVIDFKNFEKVNMNYDFHNNDEHLNNLLHATDTLSKQVDVLKASSVLLNKKAIKYQWLTGLLAVALLYLGFLLLREKS